MFGFSKKKKDVLFGENVEKDCTYCRFNASDDDIECRFYEGDVCKKYEYDPLKREPRKAPPLRNHSKEEFEL